MSPHTILAYGRWKQNRVSRGVLSGGARPASVAMVFSQPLYSINRREDTFVFVPVLPESSAIGGPPHRFKRNTEGRRWWERWNQRA